jgi:hypothetical protein
VLYILSGLVCIFNLLLSTTPQIIKSNSSFEIYFLKLLFSSISTWFRCVVIIFIVAVLRVCKISTGDF